MCQDNRTLDLGKITVSRCILMELTVEKINELLSYHKRGYIMLGSGEWIKQFPEPVPDLILNFYLDDSGRGVVIGTDLMDDGTYYTDVSFQNEDYRRGYFDWIMYQSRKSPFTLGKVVCTTEAEKSLGMQNIQQLIEKQRCYDWGIVHQSDWALNDQSVENGGRVLSHHYIGDEYVYVLTEADRSSTTIMLEYEY